MTTKERLLEIVDELSELELDDTLRFVEARRSGEWWTHVSDEHAIVLNDEEAERFLDALDNPGRADEGLKRLIKSAAKYRGE